MKTRKSILIEESVYEDFSNKREQLGLNSTETLQTLLHGEFVKESKTMVHRIEKGTDFDNIVKKLSRGD
jgi:hypothetical protein